MNTRKIGNIAEDKAVDFLENLGFEIIDRNYYSKFGEIDIIAMKDSVYHFVEVKSGKNFEPIYNISPTKLSRIIKTIQVYMRNINSAFSIDAIIIKNGDIEFLENISF